MPLKDTVRARLPKAAQQELGRLERDLDYYKGLYETSVGQGATDSRVTVQGSDKDIFLDDHARIHLRTGGEYDYIEVHLQGDDTYGRSVSVRSGASQIVVHHSSGNSISVEPEGRR